MDIRRLNKRLLSLEEEDQSFGSPKPFTKKREDEPYTPTNRELSFLDKAHSKKFENIDKMIKEFDLTKEEIENLIAKKMLTLKDGVLYSYHKEDPETTLARAWINLKPEEKVLIQDPKEERVKKVSEKSSPVPLKIKTTDYSLAYKMLRNDPLSPQENRRANELLRNGTIPQGPIFLNMLKPKPKSWVLAKAKNRALAQHFTQIHNIDIEAIKFINLFKQVTPQQLAQIAKDPSNISIYTNHLDPEKKFTTSSKLLKKETMISPEGAITYLSINHTGDFNGRKLLEQHIPKKEINAHPQKRSDLRYHDIKVVDSLLHVTNELKKEGYSIKEIHNESAQYAKEKMGKQNNQRQNGPSYMDAIIKVEKIDPLTGNNHQESIAVEYGNYSLTRMKSKIESSHFDKAYIYSKSNYCSTYQKNINTNKNVTFRSL